MNDSMKSIMQVYLKYGIEARIHMYFSVKMYTKNVVLIGIIPLIN